MELQKYCVACKTQKQPSEFSTNPTKKDNLHTQCKSCSILYSRQYYEKNKQRLIDEQKVRYNSRKDEFVGIRRERYGRDRIKILAVNSKYYYENKDSIYEAGKKWKELNKDKTISYKAQRRAKKLKATPSWLTKEQKQQIQSFYKESRCLKLSTGIPHCVDHIIPLQGENVCGLHVPWNLQILTESENCSKSNKLLEDNINGN